MRTSVFCYQQEKVRIKFPVGPLFGVGVEVEGGECGSGMARGEAAKQAPLIHKHNSWESMD